MYKNVWTLSKIIFLFTLCFDQNSSFKLYFHIVIYFSVSQVNFDSYKAIVSFVNVADVHWKFLVSTEYISVI